MTSHDFYTLYGEALTSPSEETYVAEWATSSVFDSDPDAPAPDYDAIVRELSEIYRAAHITVKEIRAATGLSQARFAEAYCIPRRTLEDWETGKREPPPYIRLWLAWLTGAVTAGRP